MERERTLTGRPVRPEPRRIPDEEIQGLVTTIQHDELNAVDRAQALTRLRTALNLSSWQHVAEIVGISRQHVYNILNVTRLPEPIRDDIRAGDLTEKHARALLRLRAQPEDQRRLWEEIHTRLLSGRAAEERAREMAQAVPAARSPAVTPRQASRRRGQGDLMSLAADILAALVIASPDEVRDAAPLLTDVGRRIDEALHRAAP